MAPASSETPRAHLATFADLLAIPEDERYHEVLDGEVVRKLLPRVDHGAAYFRIAGSLGPRFNRKPNGPARPGGWLFAGDVDIRLAPHQIVRPDAVAWRRERMPALPAQYPCDVRPDWVCEIMTDSDARRRDGVQKRRIYADARVPHYWLLDTERFVLTVLRLTEAGYVEVLQAGRDERVRAEPFDAVELAVGVLFGDDED